MDRASWNDLVERWLAIAVKSLAEYCLQTAAGERGVFLIDLDVDEIKAFLNATTRPNVSRIRFQTTPTFVPVEAFLDYLKARDADSGFHERVKAQLATMDPSRYIAVEFRSEVGGDGLTRFMIIDRDLIWRHDA